MDRKDKVMSEKESMNSVSAVVQEADEESYFAGMILLNNFIFSMKSFLKGDSSLATAFWIYGIIVGGIFWYVFEVLTTQTLQILDQFVIKIGPQFVLAPFIPRFILWIALSVGIWRSGKNAKPLWRWCSRLIYVGCGSYFFVVIGWIFIVMLIWP